MAALDSCVHTEWVSVGGLSDVQDGRTSCGSSLASTCRMVNLGSSKIVGFKKALVVREMVSRLKIIKYHNVLG